MRATPEVAGMAPSHKAPLPQDPLPQDPLPPDPLPQHGGLRQRHKKKGGPKTAL
jgi:hypothetical protein